MSSIETLEDRAAPSYSIGDLLALGMAAELWPLRSPVANPIAAELSYDAPSAAVDDFIAGLAGIGEDDAGSFDVLSGASGAGGTVTGHRVAGLPTLDAGLAAAGAQLVPDPLASVFAGSALSSPSDLAFFTLTSVRPAPEIESGAERTRAAGAQPPSASSVTPAPPEAALNTTSARLPATSALPHASASAMFLAAASLQSDSGATDDGGSLQLLSENSAPVAVDDSAEASSDMPIDIDVLANDYDPDGDPFEIYSYDQTSVEGGSVSGTGFSLTYAPPMGFTGTDSFTYDIIDWPVDMSPGQVSNRATVTVTVGSGGGTNTPPDAVDDIGYTAEGQTVTYFVLENDSDPDLDLLTITSVSQPTSGTVTFGSDSITYTPDPGSGGESLQYTIEDGNGGSDTATLTITMVTVTDYTLEWRQPDGSWLMVPHGEHVWSHDILRWTAHYSPSNPPVPTTINWLNKPWESVDDPNVPWNTFATVACDCPVEANPGAGDWAITLELHFDAVGPQTAFVAIMQQPRNVPDIEITSISWAGVDPGDGATNLSDDNALDMGGGWRIFPDQNTESGPNHKTVEVVITITPARLQIPIKVRLYDPDDPTDADGPIDADPNNTDNRGSAPTFPTGASTNEVAGASAIARVQFQVANNPGNNYRVLAARRDADFSGIRPISSQTNPEVDGRLYRDENGNGVFDGEDPYIDETRPLWIDNGPAVHSTPLLTVWRRLNIEVDSMGAPPDGQQFDPDDLLRGDVADPDTSGLAGAFRPAFIEVHVLPAAPNGPSNSAIPFGTAFTGEAAMDCFFVGQRCAEAGLPALAGERGTKNEQAMYWTAYVAGIYEWRDEDDQPLSPDNDHPTAGDTEFAFLGLTRSEQETGGADYSTIPMEIMRDVGAQHGWTAEQTGHVQRIVAVHEIGHQFGLTHPDDNNQIFPGHVMTVPYNDASEAQSPQVQNYFVEADIHTIRNHGSSPTHP